MHISEQNKASFYISFLQAILFVLFLSGSLSAYSQINILETRINLPIGEHKAKLVLVFIEKQTNIRFSYSDNLMDSVFLNINSIEPIPLKNVLDTYFAPKGLDYKTIGSQVILFKRAYPVKWYSVSGFVSDAVNSESIIGAAVYLKEIGIGTITNPYGYFSLKLPEGQYTLMISSLGYEQKSLNLILNYHSRSNIKLNSKSYNVSEVTVSSEQNSVFLESTLMNMVKIDIKSLQELPGLFGENDALRNLSVLPGVQANEYSTSSINVRGGGTDQTSFLMDEATLYSASHFGGFFSVFNPDVVNNVQVFKSDIPVREGGALSSLIDIHLREGNSKQWKIKGGIGLISARGLVEGPIKKDTASVLFAFRRTYVDNLTKVMNFNSDLKDAQFYFYDANFKLNYKLNKNNRLYLSGYAGSDVFNQYTRITNKNYMGTARWNHLFGPRIFSNAVVAYSNNVMSQGTQVDKELLYWQSEISDVSLKSDISYFYSKDFKITFGYVGKIYNIHPYSLLTRTEQTLLTRYESTIDRMMLNSLYLTKHLVINRKFGIDAGIRATHMITHPFTDSLVGVSDLFWQPQLQLSYAFNTNTTIKTTISHQVQPLHQLPLSMVGVAVNRWMSSSNYFKPQTSLNYSLGYHNSDLLGIGFSADMYYRQMDDLIETMQDRQILYTDDPQIFLRKASGVASGVELLWTYVIDNFKGMISYDYCKALWKTDGLNKGKAYEATHTRKHSLNLTGVYSINKRMWFSATWIFASGIPFTAASGKYLIDERVYLQFDNDKINTKKLPPYHRLDISFDMASKKNGSRKWQSFWNFSVYNTYFKKNALGVAYFIPDNETGVEVQRLNPGFFYMYQFVPSASYRFEF